MLAMWRTIQGKKSSKRSTWTTKVCHITSMFTHLGHRFAKMCFLSSCTTIISHESPFTAFKTKVKPFIGAKSLLLAIGFAQGENDPTHLVLKEDADIQVIKDTKTKLEAAFVAFG
mmetsp:Transcript_15240/g.37434  ORF Transcript_15240/g.37434 Transcript_15240/m.37434 type:complete len:115 (-) Transcript_15240:1402-1746(-)